ncbi:uncharacterized protein [Nicotiana tomentosiformis]|uniref:uncharacterized protein n=1 Tax=Nicotiana tomentosiformis TaxID=4098 RepID=UPI00388CB9A5
MVISRPLTDLLKKDCFKWTNEATHAFEELKRVLTTTPVLPLPNFDIPFIVETNACDMGLGAKALKFLLEQQLHTGSQLKWITKHMQFDFEIEYKKGKENKVADALPGVPEVELATMSPSTVRTNQLDSIQDSWRLNPGMQALILQLQSKPKECKGYSFTNQQLRRYGKLVVGVDLDLSDRDLIFTSEFWQELFSIQGVTLSTSTAYHPHFDGQTENGGTIPPFIYLSIHRLLMKLFMDNLLLFIFLICQGILLMKIFDRILVTRELKFQLLKHHLARSQQRIVSRANNHRSDRQFSVGDWMYLKAQPYRQVTLSTHHFNKLSCKYYGPYMITEKVGQPVKVLQRRMVQKGNKVVTQWLVQWEQVPEENATLEDAFMVKARFPAFLP